MSIKRDLTKGSIIKGLLWVSLPVLVQSLINMTYNLTDMYWVSKVSTMGLEETDAIAGVGIAGFFMWFGMGVIALIKTGTSIKVSHAVGAKEFEKVNMYGNTAFVLMGIIAIVYALLGFYFKDVYANMWGSNEQVVAYTVEYLSIITIMGLSIYITNTFSGVYNGLGVTTITLLVTSVGLFVNMILDPIFILDQFTVFGLTINGLGLTVKGAAIATAIAQGSVLLIYIGLFFTKFRPFDFNPFANFSWDAGKRILKLSWPVALQSVLFTLIAMVVTFMQAEYGAEIVATQRLGSQVEALAWMMALGAQVGIATFVGQNFGAHKFDRIKHGYAVVLRLMIPYGIVVGLVLFFFARQIFGLFTDDPAFLDLGETYLRILSFSQLFMIIELSTAGVFTGLGKTKYPAVVGVLGNILRIPGAALLRISFGFVGIWWAISLSSVLKGVVLVFIFVFVFRKILGNDPIKVEI